jgi:hypothetical protein
MGDDPQKGYIDAEQSHQVTGFEPIVLESVPLGAAPPSNSTFHDDGYHEWPNIMEADVLADKSPDKT